MTDTTQTIETDLSAAADVGALVGGPIGAAVDAGVKAGLAVAGNVEASKAAHVSAAQTAVSALSTLVTVAPQIAASALPGDAAQIAVLSTKAKGWLAELESFAALLGL